MSVELRDKVVQKTARAIFIDGEDIGELWHDQSRSEPYRYHAIIRVDGPNLSPHCGIAQGFGADPEEAIQSAFTSTRNGNQEFIAALDEMAARVMGGAA